MSTAEQQQQIIEQQQKQLQTLYGQVKILTDKVGEIQGQHISSSSSQLKAVKPSTFDGKTKGHEVDYWLSEVERYFIVSGVNYHTDIKCVPYAVALLKLDASIWWDNHQHLVMLDEKLKVEYWSQFKDVICKHFQPANRSQNARDKLAELRQTHSVLAYTSEFNKLCIRIDDIAESEKLDKFIRGLKPNIRKEVKLKTPHALIDAISYAQTIDNIEYSERSNYKTSSSTYQGNRGYNGPAPMEVNQVEVDNKSEVMVMNK